MDWQTIHCVLRLYTKVGVTGSSGPLTLREIGGFGKRVDGRTVWVHQICFSYCASLSSRNR